ncbi:hypothetical protein R6Q59_031891 [Mikania micrantha]
MALPVFRSLATLETQVRYTRRRKRRRIREKLVIRRHRYIESYEAGHQRRVTMDGGGNDRMLPVSRAEGLKVVCSKRLGVLVEAPWEIDMFTQLQKVVSLL